MGTVVLVCEADTEITHASSQSKQNDTFESVPAPKKAKMADLFLENDARGEKRIQPSSPCSHISSVDLIHPTLLSCITNTCSKTKEHQRIC